MKMSAGLSFAVFCLVAAVACTQTVYVPVSASPTTSPTATPTSSPALGSVVLSATSLAFTAVGASAAQTVSVTQLNYTGNFTPSTAAAGAPNSCSGIATITVPFTVFVVTPVAAGSCTFTIAGGGAQSALLAISVTTTSVGGS